MVRGRRHQYRAQLHRSASAQARGPDRDHLGGRRSLEVEAHHLCRACGSGGPFRQRAERQRRQEGRSRHHLSADDSRGGLRDARLRAHRRHPFGGVRRLLARRPRRPHRRRQIRGCDHRGRRSSRRPEGAAQGQCRHGGRKSRRRQDGDRRQAHRRRHRMAGRARRLAGRSRTDGDSGLSGGADERGRPAVHPLHIGLDRRAQGRGAHHRRLSRLRLDDPSICVRLSRGRHLLVHRRRRMGDRPQLYSVRAPGQWRDDAHVRGHSELPVDQPVLGSHRQAQGEYFLHGADRDPVAHGRGRGAGEEDQPRLAASSGLGRRADQSGGVGMVLPRRRRQPLPDRRHLVADRDRRHPHFPIARRDEAQGRVGDQPVLWRHSRNRQRRRQCPRERMRGQPGHRRFRGPASRALSSATMRDS